jgi:hypothetical protein
VPYFGQSRAVGGKGRLLGRKPCDEVARYSGRRSRLRKTEKDPGAFPVALDEARLGEKLQMAGDARLRLAQDRHELAHGELGFRQESQKPQARCFTGCGSGSKEGGKRQRLRHSDLRVENNMHISLYV